jgi:predicted KAP-like P-loop ATPase
MGDSIPIVADIPQADPRLGYAEALSDAIRGGTPPQFTIGIYGPWGSGKSSLLNAIHRELTQGEDVLPVFFDAWRYERSEYIVVPLLHAIYSETLKPEDKRVAHYFKQALTSLIYSLNFKLGIVELDLEKFRDSKDTVSLVPLDDAL